MIIVLLGTVAEKNISVEDQGTLVPELAPRHADRMRMKDKEFETCVCGSSGAYGKQMICNGSSVFF